MNRWESDESGLQEQCFFFTILIFISGRELVISKRLWTLSLPGIEGIIMCLFVVSIVIIYELATLRSIQLAIIALYKDSFVEYNHLISVPIIHRISTIS